MKWGKMVPELTVSNFAESLEFYVEKLGFEVAFSRVDPAFAYLDFEGAQLMVEEFREDGWNVAGLKPPYGRGINLQIECSDAEVLRDRLKVSAYPLYREIEDEWYDTGDTLTGQREFLVQDPDGYLLRFSQYLGELDKTHRPESVESPLKVTGERQQGKYTISTDKSRLNFGLIHGFLKRSYWAEGVSEENVKRRIENSLVFGLYEGEEQAGFARAVTDYAAFAYLADVFIVEAYRGKGLGKRLVEFVLSYPGLENLKWSLATKDAQELYRRYGFTELKHPEENMEKQSMEKKND